MDTNRAYIGAAILIVVALFSNLILYGIARNVSRNSRNINYMKGIQILRNSLEKQNAPLEELRKKVEELGSKKKEDEL